MRRRADALLAIRRLEARDVRPLVALLETSEPWRTLGYVGTDWRRLLGGPLANRDAWVIDDGGSARGIAIVRRGFLLGDYLELIAVNAATRSRGLGARLLAHCESEVFARARNLFVCVSDFNADARRFYRRHGYVQVGRLDELLIAGSAEILLRKTTGSQRAQARAAPPARRLPERARQ